MIIKNIHINNFGKFNNFDLSFFDGVNIIYGQNEAGKTTILNFIMMMFYGSTSKSQDIFVNERKRYMPWNSDDMSGSITIEKDGINYRIERSFKASNTTDEVNIYELETGKKIDIPNPKMPGEFFFDLGYEAFKKTLFISSESVIIENDGKKDELTQRLVNIVTTGEEDISYKKVISNIDKKLESFISKSGNKGIIVDLNNEIENLKMDMEEAKADEMDKKEFSNKLNSLKEEIDIKRNDEVKLHEIISLLKEKETIQANKRELLFGLSNPEHNNIRRNLEKTEDYIDEVDNKNVYTDFNLLDSSIFAGLLFAILAFVIPSYILFIPAILAMIFYFYNNENKKKAKKELLDKAKFEKIHLEKELQKIENEMTSIHNESYYMDQAIKELDYNIEKNGIPVHLANYDELDRIRAEISNIERDIERINATARERYRGKKNLSTLEYELYKKNIEKTELENNYELLIKTKELVQKSFSELEIGFAKILNDKASEIISELTHDKYNKLLVSNDFDISIQDNYTKNIKEWKYLSSGTIDQLYLSLRFALIGLIINDKDKRILLLDDIFIRYDDIRARESIKLIKDKSDQLSQVLSFTCQDLSKYNEFDFNIIRI